MSLHNFSNMAARYLVAGLISITVAGCFQPLHGRSDAGNSISTKLALIDVKTIQDKLGQERIGYYVQQELKFDLDNGTSLSKIYKLEMTLNETLQSPIVDTATGRANSATLSADVTYTLKDIETDKVMTTGLATASATYDRNPQRFASLRAARDAEIRISKVISDQIKIRISAYFKSNQ
jgi:LPS-assembly lipoprotein